MKILVINSGSSSIKYKLFEMPSGEVLNSGLVERIGEKDSGIKNHQQGLEAIILKIGHGVDAVGHRVVHGAEYFKNPTVVDRKVIAKIRQCSKLAPLHNPPNLEGILACQKLLPGIKQVAVFDTAFYQTLTKEVYTYALPYDYYKKYGIRKYGFHGTSHSYVAKEAAKVLKQPLQKLKIITCHLGNGCSITAIKHGAAVDTSMGFTPLEGLVMGTRCGDVDPAVVTHIMNLEDLKPVVMERILNKKSGLLGVSGISNDFRVLAKEQNKGNLRAKLALDLFVYRIKKYIGAYTAAMGGVDAIIFTAGIGENVKRLKDSVTKDLVGALKKKPKILAIPTNEELMIAQQTHLLIK